jgi:DNA-binding SARP family transcriptional activator
VSAPAQPRPRDRVGDDSPPLTIRLFGELDLRVGEEPLAPLASARARSLLAYLILHAGVPQPRQHLAFLLWPDTTEAQARTNLRKVLHTLRREAEPVARYLEVTARTLLWRVDASVQVDVLSFEAALARADEPHALAEDATAALRSAVDLYRGDLLEGCYDEWLVEARERVRDRYAVALRRLAELLAEQGCHVEATRFGREVLRCDPLREETYRLLMALHDAAGDRAAALRVYHQCVTTLQRELGVGPSPTTTEAYAALVHPEQVLVRSEAAPELPRTPLVGRFEEWRQLTDIWRDTEGGRAQLVVVTGEAGVGKTRLVDELSSWCSHRGALVLAARSYPTEGELGYSAVISWLRARELASHVQATVPADRAALARLLPELDVSEDPPFDAVGEAEQRRRMFDAASRVLTAPGRPTLLVIDDGQWCDAQSLALVHYVIRLDPSNPILVVVTIRREELDDDHALTGLIDALQSLDRATEIDLGRLNRGDTEVLARHLDFTPASGQDLYAETEGNPLFIVETVRAGRQGAGEVSGLTPKLQALIGARLRQCSSDARRVLGVAAAVGRAFTTDLVRVAAGEDDLAFARALDELWRRGVIREHGSAEYDFSHGKIRDVAYGELSPVMRRQNHRRVAEALRELHTDHDAVSGQIAHNYHLAGHAAEAASWYQRAALEAQRRYADDEAVRLLDQARELVPALPAHARLPRELEIVSALPTALIGVEGFGSDRVAEAQRRAAELAGLLGVDLQPPLLRSLVMSSICRKDFDGARVAAEQLHAAAERAGDDGLIVEGEYLLGIVAFWSGQPDVARSRFESVVERFGPEHRSAHLVRFGHDPAVVCLSRLANTLWFLGRPEEARQARDDAIDLAAEVGHPYTVGVAYVFGGLLAVDLDEADQVRPYALALRADERQPRPSRLMIDALEGYAEIIEGRIGEGTIRIRAALERCGPVDAAPGLRAALERILVAAHEKAGDAQAGLSATRAALDADGSRLWEAEIRRVRAELLAATGADRRAVDAELARAEKVARAQGATGLVRRVADSRSRLAVAG